MSKVLIVATSHETRGGITSVINAYKTGEQWDKYGCYWLETHKDKNIWVKLWMFIKALISYCFLIYFYDIVHIHLSEPHSALRKLPFMWLAKLFRKKIIIHFHSFSVETTIKSSYSWMYSSHFINADKIVTLSEYWKKEISNFINDKSGKVIVVYNPCPQVKIYRKERQDNAFSPKHYILYAGSIIKRKGYEDLIKAFAKIAKNHRDWGVFFAGNGEIDNGKSLANCLGVSSQVYFLGWLKGDEKDNIFRSADIFCLPSYAEGFPMAVLDAWAYGLPVITTPVGGIPDIGKNKENMLLFQPGNINMLADCIEKMIDDNEFRKKIADESFTLANTTFNIHSINHQIESLYESLCV